MKPRYRPGKPAGSSSKAKMAAKAKPLTKEQINHLASEAPTDQADRKAGRGGPKANWDTDYAEGISFDMKKMPNREPQSISEDGTRKFPRGRR